jgi:hypothetical protein
MAGTELEIYALGREQTADFLLSFRFGKSVSSFLGNVWSGGIPDERSSMRSLSEILTMAGESSDDEEFVLIEAAVLNLDWIFACEGIYERKAVMGDFRREIPRLRAANTGRTEIKPNMRLVGRNLRKYYEAGISVRDGEKFPALDWYDDSRKFFEGVFGDDAFLFLGLLAATSPRVSVKANLGLASSVYMKIKATGKIEEKEYGIMVNAMASVRRILNGDFLLGPKIYSFFKNLLGDKWLVTVDKWILEATGSSESREGENALGFPEIEAWKIFKPDFRMSEPLLRRPKHVRISDTEISYTIGGLWRTFARDGTETLEKVRIPDLRLRSMSPREKYPYRYAIVADAVRQISRTVPDPRLANSNPRAKAGLSPCPRDFQAAAWAGVKLERDPTGIEDFGSVYRKAFGESPLPIRWERGWSISKKFPHPGLTGETYEPTEEEETEEE